MDLNDRRSAAESIVAPARRPGILHVYALCRCVSFLALLVAWAQHVLPTVVSIRIISYHPVTIHNLCSTIPRSEGAYRRLV